MLVRQQVLSKVPVTSSKTFKEIYLTVQDEQKIKTFLATNTQENQKLAIQLMQGVWNFTLVEALRYCLDYYCTRNINPIRLYLEPITIYYGLHFMDDGGLPMNYDSSLVFQVEQGKEIIRETELASDWIEMHEDKNIRDDRPIIVEHFNNIILELIEQYYVE